MAIALAVIGTPSPVSYVYFDILQFTLQETGSEYSVISANTAIELQTKVAQEHGLSDRSVVLISDYPQADLISMLNVGRVPTLVCVDSFLTIAHFLVASRGSGGVEAARYATNSLVNFEPLLCFENKSIAIIDRFDMKLSIAIEILCNALNIDIDRTRKAAIIKVLIHDDEMTATLGQYTNRKFKNLSNARISLEQISPLDNELLDFLAPYYDVINKGKRLETLEWPPFALLRPEFPDRLTVGPIDLTGPARFIYYGPYFALPRGQWRADMVLEVSDCHSDNQIAIDAVSGNVLVMVKANLPAYGVYGCELQFQIVNPSAPVEIRMQLLTGAIEGSLALRDVKLTRVGPVD